MNEAAPPVCVHDVVITPTGERARVLRVADGEVALRYLNPLPGADAEFSILAKLVRVWEAGKPEPRPVRV